MQRHQYAEDETNKKIFMNILNSLKDIQSKPVSELFKQVNYQERQSGVKNQSILLESLVNQKVTMMQDMNRNMHLQMKNPYFEMFFKIIDKSQWQSIFDVQQYYSGNSQQINFFDFITLMCRFLKTKDLRTKFNEIISYGVVNGNLEVLTLIGLNSPQVFPVL